MNKLTKLLSVFVIAGTVSAGVAMFAGCHTHSYSDDWSTSETQHWHAATCEHTDEKKDLGDHVDADKDGKCDTCGYQMETEEEEEHQHTYSDAWSKNETQHWHAATCEHKDEKKDVGNHVDADKDGRCDTCGYEMEVEEEVEGIPAPAGTNGLVIEKTTTSYALSATSPTIDIAVNDIKVYFAKGTEKLEEVDLEDCQILYTKGSQQLENLNGINAAGKYTIMIKIEGVLVSGETQTRTLVNTVVVEVTDPVVADSLAINADAVKTQTQSTTDSMTSTWKFTVTLASGTKVDVTDEVSIAGIETTAVGEHEATVTITYDSTPMTLKVPYTITADQNSHSVSYAVNFGGMEAAATPANTQLKQGDVVVATILASDGKAKVASSSNTAEMTYGDKVFTQRFSFGGGSFTSTGSYQKNRAIEINTLGAAKITIYWATNGTAGRGIALSDEETYATLSSTSEFLIKATEDVGVKTVQKTEVNVSAAGKYYLTTATNSDIYIHYIQVDNIVSGAGEDVGLPTATETQGITLNTEEATKTFTVGDTFSSEGVVVKKLVSNPVTCDATYEAITDIDNITYSGYDMTKLGEQTVTVKYGEFEATYKITVTSAVSGVTGISASHNLSSLMVDTASDSIALTKDNISAEIVGENDLAVVTITSIKVNGVELAAEGTNLAPGSYTIVVIATVSDGTDSADFTDTIEITVTVKPADNSTASFLVEGTESGSIEADGTIVENGLFTATTEQKLNYSIGKDETAGVPNPNKPVTVELQDGSSKTFTMGLVQGSDTDAGATTQNISITAKEAITLKVYVAFTNNSFNSDRASTINYKVGEGTVETIDYSKREKVATITVTLQAGETLTVNATNNATSAGRLWLFGIEAAAVAE